MWFFRAPHIVYGEDALSYLASIQGERAFIVTDANLVKLGVVDRVAQPLTEAGMAVEVFSEVEPDPSIETVTRASEQARAFHADWVIGLGGGSAMDTAKMVRVLADRTDLQAIDVNPIEPINLSGRVKLCTIPTTSGTGAEASWPSIVTDHSENRKLILGHTDSLADVAIVDPSIPAGMPAWLTADTGMDALVHAIEIYAGPWHNDFVDGMVLQAIKLIFEYLPRAYRDGTDMEAREKLHIAATMAGVGINNSNVGLAHALAHSLGGVFHPPHGRATSTFLPYTLQFITREAPERYADIARWLDLPGDTPAERAAALIAAYQQLQRQVNHPADVRGLNVPEDKFYANLDHIVEAAEADGTMFNNPRVPDTQEVRRLFEYAYAGHDVDF